MRADEQKFRKAEARYWQVEGVEPTEQWLDLAGTGTRVRMQTVGDGPPVLFVHGGSVNGTCWAPLVARLEGFRCLVLDRPGCGLSDRIDARFDDVAAFVPFAEQVLVDVLDALDIDSAHVVSTSLGGYYALRTAAAHPERVERIVEMGFPIGAGVGDTPLVMRLAAAPGIGRLMTRLPVTDRIARSMLAQIGLKQALASGRLPQEAIDWFRSMINDTDTMRNELTAMPPIFRLFGGLNESTLLGDDVLSRIEAPMHFLWGAEDPFGGEEVAYDFVARIDDAVLEVMPGAGHAVWMDDPDRAAEVTAGFLSPGW